MKLSYRADIDGIRAIAVLAVVFYHFDFKAFSGGFVGVDIFFVISGYLITTIIVREIDENDFSLLKFYDRRIRRIFPALFTVLFASTIAAALLFGAKEFRDFGNSLMATALFVSNFFFWSQAGYFDAPSLLKPLLHTWSLAVEEQYYIFFPLLLVFLTRYLRSKLKFILLCIAVISFSFSVYSLSTDANSTFYLLHMRIWELLIGSLLAIKIIPTTSNVHLRNWMGAGGLAMLTASIFLYTSDTPFPGSAALLPTLGTAFIIYSGIESDGKTFVARILSFQPVVFIGKISYSLYLWHWPVIVFVKYYLILELTTWQTVVTLLLVFILATLSWKFVELPFRLGITFGRRKIFMAAAIAMILTIAFGAAFYSNGFSKPLATKKVSSNNLLVECNISRINDPAYVSDFCIVGKRTVEPSFLLMGDSHARRLAPALQAPALKAGAAVIVVYKSTCPMLLDIHIVSPFCDKFIEVMLNYIQAHPNIKTVILSCRWASYAEGVRYKAEAYDINNYHWIYPDFGNHPDATQKAKFATLFKTGLNKMVEKLLGMGRKVVIVGQVPEIGYNVPAALSIAERTNRDVNKTIAPSLNEYLDRNKLVIPVMKSLAEKKNVQIVDPSKVLCKHEKCQVAINGMSLYLDDDHLSTFGAHYIAKLFDVVFAKLAGQ